VIPAYNEGTHLAPVLDAVRNALATLPVTYEILVIDDGSQDQTWQIISEEVKSSPHLRGVRLSRNFGKESALCAGLEIARGDAVIVMDADGQHPPSLIAEMVRVWNETRVDIVEATKVTRGEETLFGKLSACLFYIVWNKLSGYELKGASDF